MQKEEAQGCICLNVEKMEFMRILFIKILASDVLYTNGVSSYLRREY